MCITWHDKVPYIDMIATLVDLFLLAYTYRIVQDILAARSILKENNTTLLHWAC